MGGRYHATGVYVAQRRLRDDTIRAFSKVVGERAVIVVNTGDTAYARIFSALHEYCHLTLRTAGICDLDDHSAVERYCNAVAAGVLLPGELLDQVVTRLDFAWTPEAADDAGGASESVQPLGMSSRRHRMWRPRQKLKRSLARDSLHASPPSPRSP